MTLPLCHEHPWDLSPEEATYLQRTLRSQVRVQPLPDGDIRLVGGADASFGESRIYAAVIVVDYLTQQLVEQATAVIPLTFPYIPGLLSFREAPAVLAALAQLSQLPDVLMVDGHGMAHPRRFGLASHLGVLLDWPVIGCAKSVLIGQHDPLSDAVGSIAELFDGDEVIGAAVRTRRKVKPVYVSIGHRVDLSSAVRIVLACGQGYRLPEPLRLAHQISSLQKGIAL